jgi:hypothetical protein
MPLTLAYLLVKIEIRQIDSRITEWFKDQVKKAGMGGWFESEWNLRGVIDLLPAGRNRLLPRHIKSTFRQRIAKLTR